MFWKKKSCPNCKSRISPEWTFCSNCGADLKDRENTYKAATTKGINLEKTELKSPRFMIRHPAKAKGISITITSDSVSPPKIDVKTYGEPMTNHHHHHVEEKPIRPTKYTEEPKAVMKKVADRETIIIDLPEVKSLNDIDIRQLQQSIEIRAYAGDKLYFKLIPVPLNATISNEFKDGVLKIDIVK